MRQKYKTHHFECHCVKFYFVTNMSQCLASSAPHSQVFDMTTVSGRAQYQTTLSLPCSLLLCVPDFKFSEKVNGIRVNIVFWSNASLMICIIFSRSDLSFCIKKGNSFRWDRYSNRFYWYSKPSALAPKLWNFYRGQKNKMFNALSFWDPKKLAFMRGFKSWPKKFKIR